MSLARLHMFLHLRIALWLMLLVAAAEAMVAQSFVDPLPPSPARLDPATPPQPNPFPSLTFHAPPKPLPPGRTVHEWHDFLGPTHNATSTETDALRVIPPVGPAKVWEVAKGEGYAAPAIAGDKLLLFHRLQNEEVLDCLHRETGQRFWSHRYSTRYRDRYGYNNGPRCAPVTDGQLVFTYGAEGKLHCLELATGRVLWRRDLLAEFNIENGFFGVGATPLLESDHLIINVGAEKGPSVAAFDKRTGKMVWGAGTKWGASYASPVPATLHGKRRVLIFAGGESRPASGGLICLDPSTGAIDFEFPWRGRRYESVNASNPVVIGNQYIFLSECYGSGSIMLEVTPEMKVRERWTNEEFGTHFMTAIHKDGYLYGVHGHGPLDSPLVCLDMRTGQEMWRHEPEYTEEVGREDGEKRVQRLNLARASLLHFPTDGRTLCLGEWGHLLWLDLNPKEYRETSRGWLFAAGETWTGPIVSHGLLYICQNADDRVNGTTSRLICYDFRAE